MKKTPSTIFALVLALVWIISIFCLSNSESLAANKIKLAFFVDKGAHPRQWLCENLANDPSMIVTRVTGEDICNNCLQQFDVLFVPGGSGKAEALSLTSEGQEKVRLFVQNGGIYVGVCAGCYLASCSKPEYLGLLPMTTVDSKHWRRGKATLPIEFTDLGTQVFGMKTRYANVIYHNGPVLKAYQNYADKIAVLSYFKDEVVAPGGTSGLMTNAPAMVLARYGDGLVLGISPHPEATRDLSTIEMTAINWLYNNRPQSNKLAVNSSLANPKPLSGRVQESRQAQQNTQQTTQQNIKNTADLSDLLYQQANNILARTSVCHYRHVHEEADMQAENINGYYHVNADCSGFVSYLINAISPSHYSILLERTSRTYPHAFTYARFFCQLPFNQTQDGWLHIANYKQLKRGDIIAWQRPNYRPGKNKGNGSGHVMVVAEVPRPVVNETFKDTTIKYVPVTVIDSSSVEHFPPQSFPPLSHEQQRDGLGKGVIRLILDKQDQVIGYWEGTYSHERDDSIKSPSYTDVIGFARLVPFL